MNALEQAIANYIGRIQHSGVFTVSMDHCPSEQIDGRDWYTTVLLVSGAVQQSALASLVAQRMNRGSVGLRVWAGAPRIYKKSLLRVTIDALKEIPDLMVFAISATENAIVSAVPEITRALNVSNIYAPLTREDGRRRVKIGPVFRHSQPQDRIEFELPERRAIMALHIAHFVHRIRQSMYVSLNKASPTALNWHFLADRFPGPPNEDMDLWFQVLLSSIPIVGQTNWGYFDDEGEVDTDLIADNLAGALNAIASSPDRLSLPQAQATGGLFYWERWTAEEGDL